MNARSLALTLSSLVIAALTTACAPESGAPLTISGIQLFAPLTGSHAAVGYLTLHNQSNAPLTIDSISSANFGNVQMHETVIREGVARMQALPTVTIEPGASLEFAAGGKHLMLLQPSADTAIGSDVSLEIHYDSGGILIVSAIMQTRMPVE